MSKVQSAIGDFHDRSLARDLLSLAHYKSTRDFQQIALDLEKKQQSLSRLTSDFEKKISLKSN